MTTVSTLTELTTAINSMNSSGGNQTILLADGDYQLTDSQGLVITASNVIIRSASGNRDAVVIKGQGMTGSVGYVFKLAADNITLADMTIGEVAFHPIQIHGERDVDDILIHNLRIYDGEQQFIKGSYDKNGAPEKWSDRVIIEYTEFEYTAGHSRQRYTGGIDVHHGVDWQVKQCVFRNFRSLTGGPTQDHAVHFWTWSSNTLVDGNTFINCDRGIGLGESDASGHAGGGLICNNMIYNDGQGVYDDVGIIVANAADAKVYNNTIYLAQNYPNAIEYRFTGTVADVQNNLVNRDIATRNGGVAVVSNNLTQAQATWFVAPNQGNLHLNYDVHSVIGRGTLQTGALHDIDGDVRPANCDLGADEKQNKDTRDMLAVIIQTDKTNLLANGRDTATFSVAVQYDDGQTVAFVADSFVCHDSTGEPASMEDNLFRSYETNLYRITARVGKLESNPVDIRVFHEDLSDRVPEILSIQHRNGQTFITFREIQDIIGQDKIVYTQLYDIKNAWTRDVSYRIYRNSHPITTLASAKKVGEVASLSGWNLGYLGLYTYQKNIDAVRYSVEDLGKTVERDTGVFVHNPDQTGTWYYAVTPVVGGIEQTALITGQNATEHPLSETIGDGSPVLQRVSTNIQFNYINHADIYEYTRWEHANEPHPNTNREGKPYDYLIAVPENLSNPAPLGIHFHCWGGSMFGGYGWWFDGKEGSILMSSNQDPYDWWTGYHENYATALTPKTQAAWESGKVRPYSMNRMKSFYEWIRANERWNVDDNQVFTGGQSMGGSGSIMFSIRNPDYAAWNASWVGVHVPSMSPQFESSYRLVYGDQAYDVRVEDGTPVWDYYSDVWYLTNYPAKEIGYITFANGKNDAAIGWEQAVRFYEAMQQTRRPHMFTWGQAGHGQRANMPNSADNSVMPIAIRKNQSLPAFTRCQLDDTPGNGDPSDGDDTGFVNRWLYWETSNIVDTATNWCMTVALMTSAPQPTTRVDITPRNVQQFQVQPGFVVEWENIDQSTAQCLESDDIIADEYGLITLEQLTVNTNGNRISLRISNKPVAAFTLNPEKGNAPLNVSFHDQSGGTITSWAWDFNHDGLVDSTLQHPTNRYTQSGNYTVSLTVTGPEGENMLVKSNAVKVLPAGMPSAQFTISTTNGIRPLAVQFTDTSSGTITNWLWTFGDGSTSSNQHPAHTYQQAGTYSVALLASGPVGQNSITLSNTIQVAPIPIQAAFSATPLSADITKSVQFNNETTGDADQWFWNFGDGQTSLHQHPSHQYTLAGTYDVTLTSSGSGGTDTATRSAYIRISDEPGINQVVCAPADDADEAGSGGDVNLSREYLNISGWGSNSTRWPSLHQCCNFQRGNADQNISGTRSAQCQSDQSCNR